ncbi:cation:dicarboxylase symporter family transporter, partial [Neobacillus drentensis]
MKLFYKNYRFTLILLTAIIAGGAAGLIFGPKAVLVKPFGDLFLNLMFMMIVPLVFFSIASAIANMNGMKRLGKIMGSIVVVFLVTASIAAILGLIGASIIHPIENTDISSIKEVMNNSSVETDPEKLSFLDHLVATFTVGDFNLLL